MKKSWLGVSSFQLALAVSPLPLASTSWAGFSACATTTPGNALSTAGYNPQSTANGCTDVDLNFENIGLNPASTGNNAPTTANIDLSASGGAISGNPSTITPILATFTSPTAAGQTSNGWYLSAGGTQTQVSNVDFTAVINGTNGPTNPAGDHWVMDALTLAIGTEQVQGTNSITVQENFCVNATTTTGCAPGSTGHILATITARRRGLHRKLAPRPRAALVAPQVRVRSPSRPLRSSRLRPTRLLPSIAPPATPITLPPSVPASTKRKSPRNLRLSSCWVLPLPASASSASARRRSPQDHVLPTIPSGHPGRDFFFYPLLLSFACTFHGHSSI